LPILMPNRGHIFWSYMEAPEDKSRIKDHKKTSMFKGVVVFEEFLRKLERSQKSASLQF